MGHSHSSRQGPHLSRKGPGGLVSAVCHALVQSSEQYANALDAAPHARGNPPPPLRRHPLPASGFAHCARNARGSVVSLFFFFAVLTLTWQIFLSVASVTTRASLGAQTCVRNCSRSPACTLSSWFSSMSGPCLAMKRLKNTSRHRRNFPLLFSGNFCSLRGPRTESQRRARRPPTLAAQGLIRSKLKASYTSA